MARSPPKPMAPGLSVAIRISPTALSTQQHTFTVTTTITQHPSSDIDTTSSHDISHSNNSSNNNTVPEMAIIKHEFSDPPEYVENPPTQPQQHQQQPQSTSTALKLLRRCNIRNQGSGAFLDCHGGGNHDPPVVSWDDGTHLHNNNQIWEILIVPSDGSRNVVVIRSCANGCLVSAKGHDRHLRCELEDHEDEEAQWLLEGVAWHKIRDESVVRFRNVKFENCVIDESGGRGHGVEYITFDAHGGSNQAFQLWQR